MKFSKAVQYLSVVALCSIRFGLTLSARLAATGASDAQQAWPVDRTSEVSNRQSAHTAPTHATSSKEAAPVRTGNHQQVPQRATKQQASRRLAPRSLENVLHKLSHQWQPPVPTEPTTQAVSASATTGPPQASQTQQSRLSALTKADDKQTTANNSSCPSGGESPDQQQDELSAFQQQQEISFGYTQLRASKFVKPDFYTLRLKVDPMKRKFSGQLMVSVYLTANSNAPIDKADETTDQELKVQNSSTRYLTLHLGANIQIKKAFYVMTGRPNLQIPAMKIGRNFELELLTLDFHPNSIPVPSQGLLLLVYSGLVNQTDSHGIFVHKYNNFQPMTGGRQSATTSNSTTSAATDLVAGLATNMQPGFARRLFPGWDEPHLKARFSLIVVLPFRGYETISNMPVKRKSVSLSCSGEPLQEVEFRTTPTMSTYLLTLVVGHFQHIESITSNNCKIGVYFYSNQTSPVNGAANQPESSAPPDNNNNNNVANYRRSGAQMALEFAVKTFDYLESMLGVKYPLSKFDMIALRDFDSGGMENWGASIFHESYLLCDNSSSNANIRVNGGSNRPKRLVVPLVVAHEIVHQWFGNLLTSRTWTYLWLNEGFAQLLMYDVADAVFPNENYWSIFVEDNRRSAMQEDELITSSRTLEWTGVEFLSQEAQLGVFDQLTYNKGAMVLRMVQFALGPREFIAGLRHYLLKHSYESVVSHDLWSALEESSTGRLQDKQLETVMSAWLTHEGFPLVSVRVTSSDERPEYQLEFQQERFTLLPAEASGLDPTASSNSSQREQPWSNMHWSIPLTISSELQPNPSEQELRIWPARGEQGLASPGSTVASLLLTDKRATVSLPKASLGDWFKLNYNAIGYFRVNYESGGGGDPANGRGKTIDLLARMVPAIRSATMGTFDRYNIVEDLFAMVLVGRKSLVYYLRFLREAYDQEAEPLVLRFIFESLKRAKLAIVSNAGRGLSPRDTPNQQRQLEWSFDRYVQRFVRKLIGAFKMRQQQAPMSHHHHLRSVSSVNSSDASGGVGQRSADRPSTRLGAAFVSLDFKQRQQQQQQQGKQKRQAKHKRSGNNNNNNSAELLELLDSVRLTYSRGAAPAADPARAQTSAGGENQTTLNDNEDEQPLSAAHLFARHFRHAQSAADQRNPLDLMGRELRASIYSAALNHKQQQVGLAQPSGDPFAQEEEARLLGTTNELRNYVTSTTTNLEAMRQQLRVAALTAATDGDGMPVRNVAAAKQEDVVFARLLVAYELSQKTPAGPERAAIAQALGTTRNLTKQIYLLNLTLSQGFFKPTDAAELIESLAETHSGRQLIWLQIFDQTRHFAMRGLLSPALKSLSKGLIERPQQQRAAVSNGDEHQRSSPIDSIERILRQLYAIYDTSETGIVIGHAIEWLRVNTLWFKRDYDNLVEFLQDSSEASQATATTTTTTSSAASTNTN